MSILTRSIIEATTVAEDLLSQSREADFCGYDPFDGLNSETFERLGVGRFPLARIAWLQLHKRSPVNVRRIVGVPKRRNPKGIALFILGLIERQHYLDSDGELSEAVALGDWLLGERVDRGVWKHSAWGYHFDWAARAFHVPRGKPNAITTCYVARALYGLGQATGIQRFTDAAIDAGFFLDDLYVRASDVKYYAYIPGESAFVHNASLWSAALVAETAVRKGDERLREHALSVARQSASMQRADGAWVYGTRSHHAFIDGFHTGYNLEALDSLQRTLEIREFDETIERGMDYYRRHFFLVDGTVKYFHDCVWPLDTHSVAQAVVTLVKVGSSEADLVLATDVLSRAYSSLYLPEGKRFVYQKGRWLTNRINYLRWTQAWAFYALSLYGARASGQLGKMR